MTDKLIEAPIFGIPYDCGCIYFFRMLYSDSTACEVNQKGANFSHCQKHTEQLWKEMEIGDFVLGKRFKKTGLGQRMEMSEI